MVLALLRIFEKPFDNGLVTGAIKRLGKVGKNLLTSPGARIFFPTIGKARKRFGLAHAPQCLQEKIVFRGEVFLREDQLTTVISWGAHGINLGFANNL